MSRETSPTEDSVPTAEEATEATEANAGVGEDGEEDQGADLNQPGIYTEHVFTDPLGVENTDSSPADTQRLSNITTSEIKCFIKPSDVQNLTSKVLLEQFFSRKWHQICH